MSRHAMSCHVKLRMDVTAAAAVDDDDDSLVTIELVYVAIRAFLNLHQLWFVFSKEEERNSIQYSSIGFISLHMFRLRTSEGTGMA